MNLLSLGIEKVGKVIKAFEKFKDIKADYLKVSSISKLSSHGFRIGKNVGEYFFKKGGTGAFITSEIGAKAGTILGTGNVLGQNLLRAAFNHPEITTAAILTGVSASSFIKPILGSSIINQKNNRSTNPALGGVSVQGPGFVSFGNSPRVRMSGNYGSSTGDLTLSLHKLRHGRK